MNVVVLGPGAMGCMYGGLLAEIGHQVTFVAKRKEHVNALKSGLTITSVTKGKRTLNVDACLASELKDKYDLLILFTKTIHSHSALKSVRHILTPDIAVMSIQNGLSNQEIIEEFVSTEQIIVGMSGIPSDKVSDSEIVCRGSGFTGIIDATGIITDRTRAIGEEITKAGLNCKVSTDVFKDIWQKVCFNAASNALTCLIHISMGRVPEVGGRELAEKVVREGIDIAHAAGVPTEYDAVIKLLENGWVDHYDHTPSMLADYLSGKETEIESINGGIVKEAHKLGLEAPINETITALIKMQTNAMDVNVKGPK